MAGTQPSIPVKIPLWKVPLNSPRPYESIRILREVTAVSMESRLQLRLRLGLRGIVRLGVVRLGAVRLGAVRLGAVPKAHDLANVSLRLRLGWGVVG